MKPWKGITYNERQYNQAKAGLVAIYLDGVRGVSPDRGEGRRMVSSEDADRLIARARLVYADLADQKPVRSAKSWREYKLRDLDDFISKAVAVREGKRAQKMTEADYAANRRALGVRS